MFIEVVEKFAIIRFLPPQTRLEVADSECQQSLSILEEGCFNVFGQLGQRNLLVSFLIFVNYFLNQSIIQQRDVHIAIASVSLLLLS